MTNPPTDPDEIRHLRYSPVNALTEEEEVAVFRLKRLKYSHRAISAEVGISRATVTRVLKREVKSKKYKPCGTNAGYARHKRKKEYPCTPCLEAHAKSVQAYKLKKAIKDRGINFLFPSQYSKA